MKKLLAGVALATSIVGVGGTAFADYGNTAVYQIEPSANIPGKQGGGVWLWIELSSDHSTDYAGSDCGHGGEGAASDKGDAAWTQVGTNIVISGVTLNGLGGFPTTIIVPAAYGHYTGTVGSFLTLPGFVPTNAGNSQLQVAP